MQLREGDIVRYKGYEAKYQIVSRLGRLAIKHLITGKVYEKLTLRNLVIIESGQKKDMDTSGFDALKSAGKDDAVDALLFASQYRGSFDVPRNTGRSTEKMLRHAKNYSMGTGRMREMATELNPNKEDKMSISINTLVAKVTDNIKDAELVTKYFGHELIEGSIKDEYFVRDNYDALLDEAKNRQKKADDLLEKTRA